MANELNTCQAQIFESYGRTPIFTDAKSITAKNIVTVLSKAIPIFEKNAMESEKLFEYYRGKQDIQNKKKQTRPDVNHKVCENRFMAITDFKTGYIAGDPIVYTSRSAEEKSAEAITMLNSMMLYENKASLDKELFDWMHIAGTAYRIVLPDQPDDVDEAPFSLAVIPPTSCFMIRSNEIGHKPVMGVYVTEDDERHKTYSCYTADRLFVVKDSEILRSKEHYLGGIPIIEYRLNEAMLGVGESVLPLLNAINYVDSDRMDGITTFVNSLCVIYNAELPEGEDGNSIREKGLITLRSTTDVKADVKILSEELNQEGAQSLKNDLYNSVLQIVGMPSQSDGNSSDSSNNGAMFLKQGYQLAETRAKDTELTFKKAERELLKIVLRICSVIPGMEELSLKDIDITFTRRAYADISSKTTVLTQLLGTDKVAPIDAWTISGISTDADEACRRGLEWQKDNVKSNIGAVSEDEKFTTDRRTEPAE